MSRGGSDDDDRDRPSPRSRDPRREDHRARPREGERASGANGRDWREHDSRGRDAYRQETHDQGGYDRNGYDRRPDPRRAADAREHAGYDREPRRGEHLDERNGYDRGRGESGHGDRPNGRHRDDGRRSESLDRDRYDPSRAHGGYDDRRNGDGRAQDVYGQSRRGHDARGEPAAPGDQAQVDDGDGSGDGGKRKKKSGVLGVLITAFLLFVLVLGGAAGGGWLWLNREMSRPGPSAEASTVLLSPGSGLNAIAARLERDGLVRNQYVVRVAVKLKGADRSLKAGEYAIPAEASMGEILDMLRNGRVIQHAVTFAEGLTSQMIVDVLSASDVLVGEITAPPEGTLLPETYQVVRGTSRQAVLDRMAAAQKEVIDRLWETRAEGLPFDTKEEALILASIVEKETGVPEERARVAAVFVNRLKRGMRLQTDPTIIYGITKGYPLFNARGERRTIRRSELDDKNNPYNTYQIDGLPPGPICNPGADSIAAVLNPADTRDIYFVADGSGGHAFAATLAEHERNVARWRRIERERLAAEN